MFFAGFFDKWKHMYASRREWEEENLHDEELIEHLNVYFALEDKSIRFKTLFDYASEVNQHSRVRMSSFMM
jgi:hypothetical protein